MTAVREEMVAELVAALNSSAALLPLISTDPKRFRWKWRKSERDIAAIEDRLSPDELFTAYARSRS